MSVETVKILAKASAVPLCDVVVIGTLPKGGGIYLDWGPSDKTSALVQMCQAAIFLATQAFCEQANVNQDSEEAA